MDFNQFTIKSQEAIQKAVEICTAEQQQAIEPAHLLKGILTQDENVTDFLFKKLGANKAIITQKLDDIIKSFPKVSGQQPYLSNAANQVLTKAKDYMKPF
ncbi:MAG TPA: Clp protease N-terminal domain-containing protein, partial [Cyclobacteriaceae bacterium]|nr:Clp protease N-terminal domain-containing protein [Cyclobacteriaceae bacterium]